MENLLLGGVILLMQLNPIQPVIVQAQTAPITQNLPITATSTPETILDTIKAKIKYYAELYGVSEITMNHIVDCESSYDVNATKKTDKEYSVGLIQLNLKAHNIKEEVARDIDFSLDFLAKNIKSGNAPQMWKVCWEKR